MYQQYIFTPPEASVHHPTANAVISSNSCSVKSVNNTSWIILTDDLQSKTNQEHWDSVHIQLKPELLFKGKGKVLKNV